MNSERIFYDTDCLSCFVSINDVSILKKLFSKVIIPYEVYDEFSKVNILKLRIDKLVNEKFIEVKNFDASSNVYNLFVKLHRGYLFDKEMGKGEAAALALAIENKGTIASNNTKDIIKAIEKYKIKRIKTGDILVKAYHCKIITETEGNQIWNKMLNQKRYLTENSFTEYLKNNPNTIF